MKNNRIKKRRILGSQENDVFYSSFLSKLICKIQDQPLGLCPAEAGVGDGFTVDALLCLLRAVLNVALDHQTLNKLLDIVIMAAGVQDLLGDANLLQVLLARVGMVGIHDHGGILKILLGVSVRQTDQILIMVVGEGISAIIHVSAQDGVGVGVALTLYLPATVNEGVGVLSGGDRVHHDRKVTAGGVLHTHGNIFWYEIRNDKRR